MKFLGWFCLIKNLAVNQVTTYTDITKYPQWKLLPEIIKNRIVKAAETFIFKRNTEINEWLGTDKVNNVDLAGYDALLLLLKIQSEEVNLPDTVWEKWVPALFENSQKSGK